MQDESTEAESAQARLDSDGKVLDDTVVLEPANELSYNDGLVSARVMSTGCTQADDFHVEHSMQSGVCQVSLVRDKQDMCRRAPSSIGIQVAWEKPADCSEADLEFMNPALKDKREALRAVLPKQ